ncbi:MAG: BamA/TamA family outer membrane protein [Sphingobacteriales bacterium]|nr:BamA/TamA family outer membrane protein [Sphingobacteriales bacterium]MBI3719541.1 BamA/TamA family outer membrane protein [Sphingobacteriales bacterium]
MEPKVKKYQKNVPFVYKNNFELKADSLPASERAALKSRIAAQIDDSMMVHVLDRAVLRGVIKNPPAFDTTAMKKSIRNIKILMNNLGYFRADVTAEYKVDSTKSLIEQGEYHVITTFKVDTKKNTIIDSLNYILPTADLQKITNNNLGDALLKKGKPFTVEKVSGEINRMLTDYRNNGYYNINRGDLYADVDTVNKALLNPDLSDFERIIILARSRNKRPMINVLMKMRPKIDSVTPPVYDTAKLKVYYIGNINVYPDYNFLRDTNFLDRDYSKDSNIRVVYNTCKFKTSYLANNIYLKKGELYKEDDYIRTINNINLLGSWQVVNVQSYIDSTYQDSVGRVNFNFYLTPVKRYSFSANVESSFSTNVSTAASGNGNILGFLGNVSLTDRNVGKEGIRASLSLRGGVEYNTKSNWSQNSRELGLTNNYVFPKFIKVIPMANLFVLWKKKPMIYKSSNVSGNISSLNRVGFFNLASFSAGAGYDWKQRTNLSRTVKMNVDYTNIYNESQAFIDAIKDNPFLRNSFQTSLVMGLSTTYLFSLPSKKTNISHTLKINLEESGVLFGEIKKWFKDETVLKNLRQYVKADVEYKRYINFQKSTLALRAFVGAGTPIRGDSGLPFFKQYFAGGPNSMRAWPIRSLGLGGAAFPEYQPGTSRFNDRVGDVQIEANIEYRYNITTLFNNVINLKGAVFMDAGNVWAIKKDINAVDDSTVFKLNNLYKQLAVGLGTGLRLDFNYFILRFDFGFRFKRPDISANNGWQIPAINIKNVFGKNGRKWRYENYNFTFGINYAF